MITHDIGENLNKFDSILFMKNGKLLYNLSYEQLKEQSEFKGWIFIKKFLVLICISIFLISLFLLIFNKTTNYTSKINNGINVDKKEQKEIANLETEFKIKNISIFDTTYEELIDIMGKPLSITNIKDNIVITNYGYFSILSYPNIQFTVNSDNNFDLTDSTVIEIDIINSKISTTKGIKINDNIDKLKKEYSIEKIYPLEKNTEYPLSWSIIKGFKNNNYELKIDDYDEYCYIQSEKKPIALIFLLKNNIIKRIILRNVTAS